MKTDLTNCLSTMTSVSYSSDTNRSMVVDEQTSVINLDALARQSRKFRGNQSPATCDALHESYDGTIYFIEFKDQPPKNIKNHEIHRKIYDSMALFLIGINQSDSLDTLAARAELYVVYQDDADDEAFQKLPRALQRWIDLDSSISTEPIRFGLIDEHKSWFKQIHTIPLSCFLKEHYSCIFR